MRRYCRFFLMSCIIKCNLRNKNTEYMKRLLVYAFALFGWASLTFADKYELDNQAINEAFGLATELSLDNMDLSALNSLDLNPNCSTDMSLMAGTGGKNWGVAALLDFFLGGIGIHRMYLGSSDLMWLYYGITCCGIFGIVPLVDFIVIIAEGVSGDIGKYCNNSSYFMWM